MERNAASRGPSPTLRDRFDIIHVSCIGPGTTSLRTAANHRRAEYGNRSSRRGSEYIQRRRAGRHRFPAILRNIAREISHVGNPDAFQHEIAIGLAVNGDAIAEPLKGKISISRLRGEY